MVAPKSSLLTIRNSGLVKTFDLPGRNVRTGSAFCLALCFQVRLERQRPNVLVNTMWKIHSNFAKHKHCFLQN